MVSKKLLAPLFGGLFFAWACTHVHAEDIDLFLGYPATAADAPNVLFVIDNTANWSQSGTDGRPVWLSEQEALATILSNLEPGLVNVGFMFYTETGSPNNNVDGGYIRSAIRFLDTDTKALYVDQVNSFDINIDKSNGGKAGLAMMEAYLYFAGEDPEAGNGKVKTDYDGNPTGTIPAGTYEVTDGDICGFRPNGRPETCEVTTTGGLTEDGEVWALPGNALTGKNSSPYNSPVPDGFCGKNYIIYISNGAAQDNTSDIRRGESILSGFGGDTSQIALTPSGSQNNPADEWARFMADSPYGITTFTVDVNKVLTGQGPGWTALLKSMAAESGGTYYDAAANVQGISDAVNDALSKILAVNSVFASVALPASANTQSTFLNQVFIGQFRPDEDANPRWFGNLKQYKLGFDSSSGANILRLLDAEDDAAIDSGANGTGFINECARSYWTPDTADTYWSYLDAADRRGECLAVANSDQSNYPDGPVVEKGGQAYMGRGGAAYGTANASSRTVKTTTTGLCGGDTGSTCTIPDFNTGNGALTSALLGDATADRADYINWARGADVQDEDGDGDVGEYRPSLHGDVIHSQPIAIDYAADPNNPRVVVFYGANDGMLRAINGNRSTAHDGSTLGTGTPAGGEFWSFMAPDFYSQVDRLYKNSVTVNFPATGATAGTGGAAKPYGPDGPLTALLDGGNRYLYAGMRRGGRVIYGFNVTNINSPSLMFRLGCTDSGTCATDSSSRWDDIGQTWSPMQVAHVDDGAGGSTPYLIMGGGYDDCEDYDDPNAPANHNCTGSDNGNLIYVLNATTGAIVNTFATERAVPGAVTIVTVSDNDKNIQYAYATDTGGNVYRLSASGGAAIGSTAPGSWVATKIADLGCGTTATATCTANRKFLYGPDVVRVPNSSKLAVFVGSGDREKPIYDYGGARSVSNYFYAIFDDPTQAGWLSAENGTCGENTICAASLTTVDPTTPLASGVTISDKGWKMALRAEEQVVSAALTVADIVNFSTHIPEDPNAVQCDSALGTATTYNVDYATGEGNLIDIVGGGLVPTPVAGNVELDDGTVVPFCIGCGGENSAIGGSQVTSGISWSQPKSRVYWKIER